MYTQSDQIEFYLDPLSTTPYTPWEMRELPLVHWEASSTDLFTLMILNAHADDLRMSRRLLGLYVNIEGNNLNASQVITEMQYRILNMPLQ